MQDIARDLCANVAVRAADGIE
ncbi:hypothetical protein [Caballeronia sp. GAWG1-1]